MKSNSDVFAIDDVGTVSITAHNNEGNGARKEKEYNGAIVVQSTSGDTGNIEVNESNLPLIAEAALKINEPSSTISSTGNSKQTTKKKLVQWSMSVYCNHEQLSV